MTMTKKLHIAIATDDIEGSIKDYTVRLGVEPCSFVLNEYALWRTDTVNFSIRQDSTCVPGQLRHLGWEDDVASSFSEEKDINGVVWERFTALQQAKEINDLWPDANYSIGC
jgi:hypothetical protein